MLGQRQFDTKLYYYHLSLDQLVPQDHLLRRIALGVSGSVVIVVTLGYRLLSFWIPVALGFVFAVWLDHTLPPEASEMELS